MELSNLGLITESLLTDSNDTDISTRDTVKQMYRLVHTYTSNPVIVNAVKEALKGLSPQASDREKISKVFYWIKQQIKFTHDPKLVKQLFPTIPNPEDKELLLTPDLLLQLKSGDCDCFSMLASSMLRTAGMPTRFITVAAERTHPNTFSHVYLEVFDRNHQTWLPFDCSHGNKPDWEYPNITRRYTWLDE